MNIQTNSFKKYCVLLVWLISISYVGAQNKFTIVLDAGHGGHDHGANRTYSDLGMAVEKNITLGVALKLGRLLEKNRDFKLIYTRKDDVYPSLTDRTNLANKSKADLFISLHANAGNPSAYGTETYVQGPNQNKENLEVAKTENAVIFLDEKDRQTFSSYDPSSPESLIALKIQQSKYLEKSLIFGGLVEENFVKKDSRLSRGVKQNNLHVLRRNAMPSVLIEMGFISNLDEAEYLLSEKGQNEIAQSIYKAILSYKSIIDNKGGIAVNASNKRDNSTAPKKEEKVLSNDYRILLMSTRSRYNTNAPQLKGLNYILPIKEGDVYKYYYATTNLSSVRDNNLKTARNAGFPNAVPVPFIPNKKLTSGYYTLELAVSKNRLSSNSQLLQSLKKVERTKEKGLYYYTYGRFFTLEDAVAAKKALEGKGIKNIIMQKK